MITAAEAAATLRAVDFVSGEMLGKESLKDAHAFDTVSEALVNCADK